MNASKGKDVCQGEECCCGCVNQYPATVCNCFRQWPERMVFNPSPLNDRHGQIGWACIASMSEAGGKCIEISRKQHGSCECFTKRKAVRKARKGK